MNNFSRILRLWIIFFSGICLFWQYAFAQEKIPSFLETSKKLYKILELQSPEITDKNNRERNTLIQDVIIHIPNILSTWNLIPTLDTTLLYKLELQKYSLSCEISAVRTVLSRWNIDMSEEEIFWNIPHFSDVYSGWIWWDPDKEFVWYITGGQMKKTGYGVYPRALFTSIENIASWEIYDEGKLSSNMTSENVFLTYLLRKIETWSSVILWWDWCTEKQYEDGILEKNHKKIMRFFPLAGKNSCTRNMEERNMKWTTPAWKDIYWVSGEHTFILLWYIGMIENPSHIIVWDTDTGRHIYPREEWLRKWEFLWYRSLVMSR